MAKKMKSIKLSNGIEIEKSYLGSGIYLHIPNGHYIFVPESVLKTLFEFKVIEYGYDKLQKVSPKTRIERG